MPEISETAPRWFTRLGLWLGVWQLWLFAFGLPPFQAGFFYNKEPISVAMFIVSGLQGGWLVFGGAKEWLKFRRVRSMALVCFLLFVAWQFVVTINVNAAFRMWFGNPEFGEGLGFYVAILVATLSFCALYKNARYATVLLVSGGLAIACALLIQLTQASGSPYQLSRWGDHIALMALWLLLAASLLRPAMALKWMMWMVLVATALAWTLDARIATAALLAALVGIVVLARIGHHRAWYVLGCFVLLLPLSFIAISPLDWGTDKRSSIGERARLNEIALYALAQEPSRLFIGNGWAAFQDDVFRYAMRSDVRLYEDGKAKPNSNLLSDVAHHTHNQALEALVALGTVGALAWLGFWISALWQLPQHLFARAGPILIALVAVSCFWFPQANMAGFMALGIAALVAATNQNSGNTKSFNPAISLTFIPFMCALLLSVPYQLIAMSYGTFFRDALTLPSQIITSRSLEEDVTRGGDRFRYITNLLLNNIKNDQLPQNKHFAGWISHVLEASFAYTQDKRSGPYVAATQLMLQNVLLAHTNTDAFARVENLSARFMDEAILDLAKTAPEREDFSALHLYRLHMENSPQLPKLLEELLVIAPNHRAALWLKGKRTNDTAMMQRALNLGAERVYPISKDEATKVSLLPLQP